MANSDVVRTGDMITVGDKVRVERGPRRMVAPATEALLSNDVTASHYEEGGRDALGRPIVLGQDMHYLDWKGEPVWYLYEEITEPVLDAADAPVVIDGEPLTQNRWVPVETVDGDEAAAVAAAQARL